MPLTRIALVLLTAALGIVLSTDASRSQAAFPAKAVRIVIPYPAGGGTDVLGRVVADQLSRKWGQTVIVENVGGAAGNIGAADVFRAAPDGYTLHGHVARPGGYKQVSLQGHAVRSSALDIDRITGDWPVRADHAQELRGLDS